MTFLRGLVVFCLIGSTLLSERAAAGRTPVKVSVFYESKCPDSRDFVVQQLLPAVLRAPELLQPVLLPHGKATTTQTEAGYEFSCQHGEEECLGNKFHACAIALTDSARLQVAFAACMMSNYTDVEASAEKCAYELGLPWSAVQECANGTSGGVLLSTYGAITAELDPALSFVPTVLLNGEHLNQTAILYDFWGQVSQSLTGEPVLATVYYEAKCPDSRDFVVQQLLPAVLRNPDLIQPVLIPFGKASITTTSDGYEFTCQHGPTECLGNMLHACGLAVAGSKALQVSFAACLMSNYTDVDSAAYTCAVELGLPYSTINECANGRFGSELLRAYGSITNDLSPPITFVPTVTLNGMRGNQTAVLNDFYEQVLETSIEMKSAAGDGGSRRGRS